MMSWVLLAFAELETKPTTGIATKNDKTKSTTILFAKENDRMDSIRSF